MGDRRNNCLFHVGFLLIDPGPLLPCERRPDVQTNTVGARVLDRPHGRFGTACGRHLQQLIERDPIHPHRRGDYPWVGREHACDIGVELAHVGIQRMRQSNSSGV